MKQNTYFLGSFLIISINFLFSSSNITNNNISLEPINNNLYEKNTIFKPNNFIFLNKKNFIKNSEIKLDKFYNNITINKKKFKLFNNKKIKINKYFKGLKYLFIKDVNIAGNTKYSKEFICKISNIYPGKFIDSYGININNAIKKLLSANIFKNVLVYTKKYYKNKIYLLFKLEDLDNYKTIDNVVLENNFKQNINIDQFKILNEIKHKKIVSKDIINQAIRNIEDFYKNNGYHEVEVKYNIIKNNNNNTLSFFVNIGEKIKIEKVIFDGNKKISDRKLISFFKLTPQIFSFSIIQEPINLFIENKLKSSIEKIKDEYNSIGFIDTNVFLDYVWKNINGNYGIKIKIIEGNKYYLDNINIIGNKELFNLSNILCYKKGDIYNKFDIKKKISDVENTSIIKYYLDNGYPFVKLYYKENIINDNKIKLNVLVKENSNYNINNIKIYGNNITNDYVIMKNIFVSPGDVFSMDKIKKSLLNLKKLGIFQDVYFNICLKNYKEKKILDLEWHIKEKTNNSEIHLNGEMDGKNIIGSLQLNINNFSIKNIFNWNKWGPFPQGDGQKLTIHSKLGQYLKYLGIYFKDNFIINKLYKPIDIFIKNDYSSKKLVDRDYFFYTVDYVKNNIKSKIDVKKNLTSLIFTKNHFKNYPYSKMSILFNNEYSIILPNNKLKYNKINDFNTSILFNRDTTNNDSIYPLKGTKIVLDYTYTPASIIHNICNKLNFYKKITNNNDIKWIKYSKFRINYDFFKKIGKNIVLRIGGELGIINPYDLNEKIFPFQMFYMGGSKKYEKYNLIPLRGYSFPEKGYEYKISEKGGTIYKKIILEIRRMIYKKSNYFKSWIDTFIEAGNIGSSYKDLTSFYMNKSVGVGVRFFWGPIGYFGIDLAYPLNLIKEDIRKCRLHFIFDKNL